MSITSFIYRYILLLSLSIILLLLLLLFFTIGTPFPREPKNWLSNTKQCDRQSVQSAAGKLSCNKTALKRCTKTEILWTVTADCFALLPRISLYMACWLLDNIVESILTTTQCTVIIQSQHETQWQWLLSVCDDWQWPSGATIKPASIYIISHRQSDLPQNSLKLGGSPTHSRCQLIDEWQKLVWANSLHGSLQHTANSLHSAVCNSA